MYGCRVIHRHNKFPSPLYSHGHPIPQYPIIIPFHHHYHTFLFPSTTSSLSSLSLSAKMSPFLSLPLLFNCIVLLRAFNQIPISHSLQSPPLWVQIPNKCNEKCGNLQIPFPFHLTNTSCGLHSEIFKLSCLNSTTLNLSIGSLNYKVLDFFIDGILVDFPGIYSCRRYFDVNSFGFERNEFYGISIDNIIGLYDCDDSSICKVGCEKFVVLGCEKNGTNSSSSSSCCYPLSDHSVWDIGDGLSVFSNFGCRGFTSWVQEKRGVKLEWAIPRNSSKDLCDLNGFVENSTAVRNGVRCKCQNGFIGDGFADGVGCLKSCVKDGHEEYGRDCAYTHRNKQNKTLILAGFFASAFLVGSIAALYGISKSPKRSGTWDPDPRNDQNNISFRKASKTRLFTYEELDLATRGFDDRHKLVKGTNGTIHAGILSDGSHIAVQKIHCKSEQDLIQVLARVKILSTVSHRNLACLLGCCTDSDRTPLIVYQFSANGTLEEHLNHEERKTGLDWYQRLVIAAEIAGTLAYLQHEISPSIYHHDLKSENIYLDQEYSIKIAGFNLLDTKESAQFCRSDVYDFGLLLLEIIAGSKHIDLPNEVLEKIRSRKIEEIVDPLLYYHEQPLFRREQMEIVADIASRCLLFGGDGRLSMMDVGRELIQITKDSLDGSVRRGPAIEETFSNSSLLQMISMSPESSFVH